MGEAVVTYHVSDKSPPPSFSPFPPKPSVLSQYIASVGTTAHARQASFS